jgi:hypothetical protein
MKRVALALAVASVVAAFVACDDDPRYVYTARRYDDANGCLEDYSAVERVPGDGVSVRCAPACLAVRDVLYVSPVCPPLPENAVAVDGSDPRCKAALDAYAAETFCSSGGGEEESDGGDDEEGGADEDAEADAGIAEDAAGD